MPNTSCDFDGGGVGIVDFLELLGNCALKQITYCYCGMLLGMIEGRHAVELAEAASVRPRN